MMRPRKASQGESRVRVQRDEVHLGAQAANQVHHFAGMSNVVVDASQQNVLKGQPFAIPQGKSRSAAISFSIVHFLVMGMTSRAQLFIRSIQRTASFGRTGSAPKSAMRGTMPEVETVMRDSGCHAFDQQTHRLHKVVVVQERFALSHEDEVERSRCNSACWSLSTVRIWPTISPAVRLR